MKFLKAHWPSIAAFAGMVIPFLMPSLLAYVKDYPHTATGVLCGVIIAAYNATAPKDKPSLDVMKSTSVVKAILLVCVLGFAFAAHAQTLPNAPQPITNIYAGGISLNSGASVPVAGTGMYAHRISDTSTYAFTVVDAVPNTYKPFTVTSNFSAGVAQKIFTVANTPIFVPTSAGVSYHGSNVGWAWSTGALAAIKIKNNWSVFPNVRIVKSSVSNGSGYQPIVGVLFGWGN